MSPESPAALPLSVVYLPVFQAPPVDIGARDLAAEGQHGCRTRNAGVARCATLPLQSAQCYPCKVRNNEVVLSQTQRRHP